MKKIMVMLLAGILLLGCYGCGSNSSEKSDENQTLNSIAENDSETVDEETLQAIKDFDEFDLLNIQDGVAYYDELFVITDYVLQNKSADSTISNLTYEYVVIDEEGEDVKVDGKSTQTGSYNLKLEARKKAELQIMAYVGDDDKHEGWGNYITTYSYDMNEKRYTVDLVNKLGWVEEIQDKSNVNFDEKNILKFSEADVLKYQTVVGTNEGNHAITSLSATIMVFNSEGIITDVKDKKYFEMGQETIEPNSKYNLSVGNLVSDEDGGHVEVSSYTYELGVVDEKGYNHFEVNLITGECIGSVNSFTLNQDVDIDISEADTYIKMFGKKVEDINYEIDSIDEGESGGTDRIKLKGVDTFLNLSGKFVLYRDYDSLLIDGFYFEAEAEDENTKNYILNALKKIFGEGYKVKKYVYKSGEYIVWEKAEYEVEFSWDYGMAVTVEMKDE